MKHPFAALEAAVGVLEREDDIRGVAEALEGDGVRGVALEALEAPQGQDGLQAFGGAVADGPAVRGRRERPAALGHVAEVGLAAVWGLVGVGRTRLGLGRRQDLRPFEEIPGSERRRSEARVVAELGLDERLGGKRGGSLSLHLCELSDEHVTRKGSTLRELNGRGSLVPRYEWKL